MKFAALLALCSFFLYSCNKNSDPPKDEKLATFNPIASDNDCYSPKTEGTYHVGTPLTTNEKIIVDLDVTRKGEYRFSTDTLNGYFFSAEGVFDTPGNHTIELTGHGTPLQQGNSRFDLGGNLHHTISVIDPQVPAPQTIPAGIYVKGTFGTQPVEVVFPSATPDGPWGYSSGDTIILGSFVATGYYPNYPPGTGDLTIRKQFFNGIYNATPEDFDDFLKPGYYPISFQKCDTIRGSDGIWIGWIDDQGQSWSTREDYDQEGSYFKILNTQSGRRTDQHYFVKIISQFKCNVYHFQTNEKRVLEVEVVSHFVKPYK